MSPNTFIERQKKRGHEASLFYCSERGVMVKGKKRTCDICKDEMPMLIDFENPEAPSYDIISLGYKTKSGKAMKKNYDVCAVCMEKIDELLSGQ